MGVAAGIAAVGTLVSVAGAIQKGQAEQAQAKYQSAVARNNAILAERQAKDAIERGKIAERNQRIKTAQTIGEQRARLAANGVVVDQGSALALTSDTAQFGELDALTIRSNADREALGFRTQGMNYEADARLSKLRGDQAVTSSYFSAASALFKGAGSVAGKWYDYNSVAGTTGSSNYGVGSSPSLGLRPY